MIEFDYFCEIIGISKQTFYNTRIIVDKDGLICRMRRTVYKDLIWYKIKKKGQTPLIDFEQNRSGFSYELYLEERKRKGEFIPTVNASVEEIIKLE
jgi:hypothetical protein